MGESSTARRPRVMRPVAKCATGPELLRALSESGLAGLWKSRKDIEDSSRFARRLREHAGVRDTQ